MPLTLYNTESRKKEKIVPLEDKRIKLYTCGPTIYNFAHIGNFRTYIFEDLLRRTLKYFGFAVTQVMNLTDVDDKTIKGAIEKGVSLSQFTDPYKKAFFEDLDTLHIERVEHYPAATAYIPHMIKIIEELLENGHAYISADGNVYFSIDKFPSYGRLAHLDIHSLKAGASERIDNDEYDKENISDFVLWKGYDSKRDGQIFWNSPFGKGRPGWHIECSAMAMEILGKSIDIHVGGVDNMFPHHENEIAQSEAYSQQRFVKHWLHSEHLLVDNKKMSKSLGNFFTLRDLLHKGYTGLEVRLALMQGHYRQQLNFTFEGLDAARSSLARLNAFIDRLTNTQEGSESSTLEPLLKKVEEWFEKALADDLNISVALSSIYDLVREVNTLCDAKRVGKEGAQKVLSLLKKCNAVLGILTFEKEKIPEELQDYLKNREEARLAKNWADADKWRDAILAKGYKIEDTPAGPRLVRS